MFTCVNFKLFAHLVFTPYSRYRLYQIKINIIVHIIFVRIRV